MFSQDWRCGKAFLVATRLVSIEVEMWPQRISYNWICLLGISRLRQPSSLDFNTPVEDANARTSFWIPLCKIWQGRLDFSDPFAEIRNSSPGGGKLNPNTIFLKILIKNKRILFLFFKNIVFGFSFPPPSPGAAKSWEWWSKWALRHQNNERGHQNDICVITKWANPRQVSSKLGQCHQNYDRRHKMTTAWALGERILHRGPQNEV